MATRNFRFKSEEETSFLINALNILTQPSATKESLCKGQSEHLIENVLKQNLQNLQSWLIDEKHAQLNKSEIFIPLKQQLSGIGDECSTLNIRRLFSSTCVLLLNSLADLLNSVDEKKVTSSESNETHSEKISSEDETSCPVLSVQQKNQISSCIQFVVVLGLCPYIPQGIGIPISERLGPGQILLATAQDTVTEISEVSRLQTLMPVLRLLVKMMNCKHLQDLVTEKFLSDAFVVLIQVRHSAKIIHQKLKLKNTDLPKGRDESEAMENTPLSIEGTGNIASRERTACEDGGDRLTREALEKVMQECNVELDRSIRQTSVPLVLREVLCLLGFVKSIQGSKSVPWFRRILAGILRDLIMHPPGIQHLLTSFLGDLSSYDTKDWQNCKAVARIISHCPVNVNNVEQFYSSVSQQLLELIHPKESCVPLAITKSVGAAVFELNSLQSELMTRTCFFHLTAPLADCSTNNVALSSKQPGTVVVSEKRLSTCISHCHRLFVIGQDTQSPLCAKLEPVLGILFSIYVHLRQSASYLKGLVKDLLTNYLSFPDTKDVVLCLLELLLPVQSKTGGSFPPIHPDVLFMSGADAGLEVIIARDIQPNFERWTHPAGAIVDLLKSAKSDVLNPELFLALLQRLTSIVLAETTPSSDILIPARAVSQEVKVAKLKELREKVVLVSLISGVGEEFGSSVIQNTSQILAFTKATLDRCIAMCASSDDTDTRMFEWETVTMSLGLLSAVLGMGCLFTDVDKKVLDSILPLLSSLAQSEAVDSHIQDMANDLKVAVATRGLISVDLSGQAKPSPKTGKKKGESTDKTSSKPLIEVLSTKENHIKSETSVVDENTHLSSSNQAFQHNGSEADNNKWRVAMTEVEDSQIPVKGHGLIQLARLVEDRLEGATTHSTVLLKIFLDNLNNSDSYIYLASVNGLAALSDLCHGEVIPSLTSEFRSKCSDHQCSWETTVKIGEAIVKATRRLGEIAPKYRDVLLSAMLFGCHHDNVYVRASCLSGLADICKLLRYSISPVIQEVLMCCRLVLTSDPDDDPRRAAALTLSSLLQGLGKDTLTVLGEDMKQLYRTLKHAAQTDSDEKVKVHAQLALEELDGIMKSFLFPPQDLKKSIKILGYQ